MILLDTNVVSEVMKDRPAPRVLAWLDAQASGTLYLSSLTLAELLFGIGLLPVGQRRTALTRALDVHLDLFAGRILAFDADAARWFAELAVRTRAAGRGLPLPDGYIAAVAASRDFIVATRDVGPFTAAGLRIIDPWA